MSEVTPGDNIRDAVVEAERIAREEIPDEARAWLLPYKVGFVDGAEWADARRVPPVTRETEVEQVISESFLTRPSGAGIAKWAARCLVAVGFPPPTPITQEGVQELIAETREAANGQEWVNHSDTLLSRLADALESLSVSPPAEVEYRAWFSAPAEWREIDKRHAREFQARGFPVEHRVKAGSWVPVTPGEGKEQ